MLKELVKERLMAAADEIFALFERTIASYEEELSRTREEKERLRQQLEFGCQTRVVSQMEDVQHCEEEHPHQSRWGTFTLKQEEPQPPHIKEEEEELSISREGECGPEEAGLSKLQLRVISVKTEDHEEKPPESSQPRRSPREENGGAEPPGCSRDGNGGQEPLSSDTHCEGDARTQTDDTHSKCCKKRRDVQQRIGCQEERFPQSQGGTSTLKQEDPEPPYIKEEEEELRISQEGECLLGLNEADPTKLQLSGVSVKTEDGEEKPPESSELHHSPSEENRGAEPPGCGSSQHMTTEAEGDYCGAPLSDSDDMTSHRPEDEDRNGNQEPLSSDTDCGGDITTQTDNKHSECSQTKTGKKRLNCSLCGKNYTYECFLTEHMRTHTGEKPFSCSVCGNSFTRKGEMISHMRNVHGEKMYSCSVCGEMFFFQIQLTRHMKRHTDIPFSCSVCHEIFPRRADLVSHVVIHKGETSFKCSVCDKSFPTVAQLDTHMRTHTGEKPSCSLCAKTFSNGYCLNSHMKTHTREKPFRCSVCATDFAQRSSLNVHMRLHTGLKPFFCSVCGAKFAQRTSLNTHVQSHTGQKPFSCSVCAKRFGRKYCLKVHMRTHT
ncbi:oocyte zinc finger protein XlCOF22-like [Entelurus aequoreus]|uniref:oocyte zinc finger protein XlCOF22-like n=1 Tax=Entelurus aequoreus TaxID=161455 RepID=UPI002B1DC66F|nr:oocyte zinc finger protein XlCOF22-like [Entelurus aequoreus]